MARSHSEGVPAPVAYGTHSYIDKKTKALYMFLAKFTGADCLGNIHGFADSGPGLLI